MGEIRIVGPGKTRGYPYPVCKKTLYDISSLARMLSGDAFRSALRRLAYTDIDRTERKN